MSNSLFLVEKELVGLPILCLSRYIIERNLKALVGMGFCAKRFRGDRNYSSNPKLLKLLTEAGNELERYG